MPVSIYICHCIQDREPVQNLVKALVEAEFEVHSDSRLIRDGEPLDNGKRSTLESIDSFILVIGPETGDSEWCRTETQYVLKVLQEREERSLKMVPVLLGDADLGALKWLIPDTSRVVHAETEHIEAALPEIVLALKA